MQTCNTSLILLIRAFQRQVFGKHSSDWEVPIGARVYLRQYTPIGPNVNSITYKCSLVGAYRHPFWQRLAHLLAYAHLYRPHNVDL